MKNSKKLLWSIAIAPALLCGSMMMTSCDSTSSTSDTHWYDGIVDIFTTDEVDSAVKIIKNEVLAKYEATNDTTAVTFLADCNTAIANAYVSVVFDEDNPFIKADATELADGLIKGTLLVSNSKKTKTTLVKVDLKIAKLVAEDAEA